MADYYFRTEGLSVGYQGVPVVDSITIGMKRGEILTLVGPNGAGKSTILKSIARQLEPVAGIMYLDRESLAGLSGKELAQRMAVVFTERIHGEMMTCEDIVAYGRYPYTGRFGLLSEEDRRIVRESMELVQVSHLRDRDFTCISDGQRQRVMLARAVCQEPEILLLDEPTSYLDVKYKLEFLAALQEMTRRRRLSVIMSLHELDLAERISDRVLCIRDDRVDAFGSPEQIFRPGYITSLFSVGKGAFDEGSGSLELEAPEGVPEVFVLAGAGTGRKVYRRLQRQGTAFVTGILYESDLDYPVAKALAAQVITAPHCQPIGREQTEKARRLLAGCQRLICCRTEFGEWESGNRELMEYAKKSGMAVEWEV